MKRLLSKFQRLRAMSNQELSYRTREAGRKQIDRFKYRLRLGGNDPEFARLLDRYRGSCKAYLECVASRRFYSSVTSENRQATAMLLEQAIPGTTARAIEEA